MSVDRYTKAMLTVIAVCLVWLSLGGPTLLTPVQAQQGSERVILAGWVDSVGRVRVLPAGTTNVSPAGLPIQSDPGAGR
jgi:hypothetical protein